MTNALCLQMQQFFTTVALPASDSIRNQRLPSIQAHRVICSQPQLHHQDSYTCCRSCLCPSPPTLATASTSTETRGNTSADEKNLGQSSNRKDIGQIGYWRIALSWLQGISDWSLIFILWLVVTEYAKSQITVLKPSFQSHNVRHLWNVPSCHSLVLREALAMTRSFQICSNFFSYNNSIALKRSEYHPNARNFPMNTKLAFLKMFHHTETNMNHVKTMISEEQSIAKQSLPLSPCRQPRCCSTRRCPIRSRGHCTRHRPQ